MKSFILEFITRVSPPSNGRVYSRKSRPNSEGDRIKSCEWSVANWGRLHKISSHKETLPQARDLQTVEERQSSWESATNITLESLEINKTLDVPAPTTLFHGLVNSVQIWELDPWDTDCAFYPTCAASSMSNMHRQESSIKVAQLRASIVM